MATRSCTVRWRLAIAASGAELAVVPDARSEDVLVLPNQSPTIVGTALLEAEIPRVGALRGAHGIVDAVDVMLERATGAAVAVPHPEAPQKRTLGCPETHRVSGGVRDERYAVAVGRTSG